MPTRMAGSRLQRGTKIVIFVLKHDKDNVLAKQRGTVTYIGLRSIQPKSAVSFKAFLTAF